MEFVNVEREPRTIPEKFRFPNLLKQSRFYDTGSGEWVSMEIVLIGWKEMSDEDKAEHEGNFGLYLENCMLFKGGMLELEEDQLAFEAELEDLMAEEFETAGYYGHEASIPDNSDLLDYLEFVEDSRHCP